MIYLTASKWEKVSLYCIILYRPTHQDFAWNKNIRWDAWIWCITVSFNWLVIEKEEHRRGCIPRAHCHVFSVPYDTVATSFNVNQLYENAEHFFFPFVRWNMYGHILLNSLQRVCWVGLQRYERGHRYSCSIDKYFSTSIPVYIMATFMRVTHVKVI